MRLSTFSLLAVLLAVVGCAPSTPRFVPPDPARGPITAIVNGYVIDGTGADTKRADVVIQGDRIVAVVPGGVPSGWYADRIIDATEKVVTPGFIDTHAHGDPLETPEFENFLAMGVTTIALGQDGRSTPALEMAEWMRAVDEIAPGPNVMTYVGHGTVRHEAGVGLSENPPAEKIERMEELVRLALEAGSYGLTTGLEYHPGSFSSMEELAAVARPVAERDLVVMSHLRSEDDDRLIEAIGELVEQGRRSGARVHVSHIKSVYGRGESRADEIRDALEAAQIGRAHV